MASKKIPSPFSKDLGNFAICCGDCGGLIENADGEVLIFSSRDKAETFLEEEFEEDKEHPPVVKKVSIKIL